MKCEVTYEELALLDAGEVSSERVGELKTHIASCAECRERLGDLREADAVMANLRREEPSAAAVLDTRRAISREVRGQDESEIMTLDEAAAFLRVDTDELDAEEWRLPVFEIGGRLRVRRTRLVEWIKNRELAYARGSAASEVARVLGGDFGKGVA
jgi:hypothetical protein